MGDASLDLVMSSSRLPLYSSYRKLIDEREIKFRQVKPGLNLTPMRSLVRPGGHQPKEMNKHGQSISFACVFVAMLHFDLSKVV